MVNSFQLFESKHIFLDSFERMTKQHIHGIQKEKLESKSKKSLIEHYKIHEVTKLKIYMDISQFNEANVSTVDN